MLTNREAMRAMGTAEPGARVELEIEGERYDAGTVMYLSGSTPTETIIEVGTRPRTASNVVAAMLSMDPAGRVQLFIGPGHEEPEAWFELKEVHATARTCVLVAGDVICTG